MSSTWHQMKLDSECFEIKRDVVLENVFSGFLSL